jgi:hypothetical protein
LEEEMTFLINGKDSVRVMIFLYFLPESLGQLPYLFDVSLDLPQLEFLPQCIGKLSSLETLTLKTSRLCATSA